MRHAVLQFQKHHRWRTSNFLLAQKVTKNAFVIWPNHTRARISF
jgi:hypothetical protein